jgi:hypothetical protein
MEGFLSHQWWGIWTGERFSCWERGDISKFVLTEHLRTKVKLNLSLAKVEIGLSR